MSLEDNIPREVRRLRYWERVEWHRKRVELEAPVYALLDSIEEPFSEATAEEMKTQLAEVKSKISKIEDRIKLNSSHEFCIARIRLAYHCTMSKTSASKLFHFLQAKKYRSRLGDICRQLNISIPLEVLLGECNACDDLFD